MSLLNDALRKKQGEIKNQGSDPLVRNMSGVITTGYKKKYYVVLVLFLSFSIIAFGAWKFFIQPVLLPNKLMSTKSIREKQTLEKHSINEKPVTGNVDHAPKTTVVSPTIKKVEPVSGKIQNFTSNEIVKDKLLKPKLDLLIENTNTKPTPESQKEKKRTLKTGGEELKKTPTINQSSPTEITTVDTMFYKKAVSYHKSNDLKKSIQMYEKIVRKNPTFLAAQFNLSAAYIQESMFSKAYPVLKQLLKEDPENSQILLNLAIVEIGMNNPASAIKYLSLAESKQNRPDFATYFHLGIANSKLEAFTDSLTWYNKAKSIEPRNPNLLFNLGIVYEHLNEYNKALNNYEGSLKYSDSFSSKQRFHIETRIQELKRFLINR